MSLISLSELAKELSVSQEQLKKLINEKILIPYGGKARLGEPRFSKRNLSQIRAKLNNFFPKTWNSVLNWYTIQKNNVIKQFCKNFPTFCCWIITFKIFAMSRQPLMEWLRRVSAIHVSVSILIVFNDFIKLGVCVVRHFVGLCVYLLFSV